VVALKAWKALRRLVAGFLVTTQPPRPGTMAGEAHHHEPDDPSVPVQQ
jgi:hypothetical protein